MKKIFGLLGLAALLSIAARAQTPIVQWTFENLAITNYAPNPAPSLNNGAGSVLAFAIGMTNWPTSGYGTNDPDILQGAGSDSSSVASGGDGITNTTEEWRIRATGAGNGWSSEAPIGTQGIQINVDTTGFTDPQVNFDWYLTSKGEANLQVEYTTDGVTWSNLPIVIPAAQAGTYLSLSNNLSGSDANSVQGYYVHSKAYSGGQQWYTNLTVNITDPAAANNTNFAVRIVNASTGADCVSGTGAALNNTSGNWRFDNIKFSGTRLAATIVAWTFEGLPIAVNTNPAPTIDNSLGVVAAECIGMQQFGGGTTNDPDVLLGTSGDTGSDGITNYTQIWRIRGAPGNGWTSTAPIGTQGAQFSVDTTGYTNLQVSFDWYLTKQGEANLQLEYTTDGETWSNLPITIPVDQAGTNLLFVDNTSDSDPDSVQGYYVNSAANSGGQEWFTNLTATITDPLAANNPLFAVRMVNASTGTSCVNGIGTALNNSSGNWRFDNIIVSGVSSGATLTAPAITPSTTATVDGPFTNTFLDNSAWRSAITGVTVNGSTLPTAAYVISAGQIVYTPSASTLLETAGTLNIAISATGYNQDLVTQPLLAGAAVKLTITSQPIAPTGNGGTFVKQPALALFDQYNNVANSSGATFTATPNGDWSFGPGSGTVQELNDGTVVFTNLSATSEDGVSGASITFTATGLSSLPYNTTNSTSFNIPAPATTGFTPGNLVVEQEDLVTANSTFSMLELSPTVANQSTPVNIFPVPATGTNALRQSSSGSTGRLADSDDGTLVCFSAGQCGDSTVSDVTTLNPRGAGTFNAQANYVLETTYQGLGSASDQARSAVTVDDTNYYMGDKGGVYMNNDTANNTYIPYSLANPANVRSLKSFGGTVYALQQEGGTDPDSTVLAIVPQPVGSPNPISGAPANGSQSLFPLEGFTTDGNVLDFYLLRSGNNGNIYDVAYYIDGTNTSSGAIYKYYYTGVIDPVTSQQEWAPAGGSFGNPPPTPTPWPTANGGDGLCAVTNVNGGVDLYYTTGSGGSPGNSVVMVHDSSAWNQAINLTATNVLYTVSSQSTLKGITFAPATTNNVVVFKPITPILIGTAGSGSTEIVGSGSSATFQLSFTNAPGGSADFTIWATTNLALPFSQWQNLGHPVESSAGFYQFSDSSVPNVPARFYQITSP
jgi:ABC-type transporter MlaC component